MRFLGQASKRSLKSGAILAILALGSLVLALTPSAWADCLPGVCAPAPSTPTPLPTAVPTDPGGQVIVSAQMTPVGELKLRVKDTGLGMSEEEIKDALEPFRRVTTEGREAPGTGLGLPLTKALAEANRTTFTISSEPRKGTLVEITFPTTRVLAE